MSFKEWLSGEITWNECEPCNATGRVIKKLHVIKQKKEAGIK